MLIFGVGQIYLSAYENPFYFIMRVPPNTDIPVEVEMVLFYSSSVEGGLFCLLLLVYRLITKIYRNRRKEND